MKKSFADILSCLDSGLERKFREKLPSWADAGCSIPSGLALEQCSSALTASYKAELASGASAIADLTGGMGVDTHAFATVTGRVFYFERDSNLAETALENFRILGLDNVTVTNATVGPGSDIPECDLIYLDPARRAADGSGRKVFLLEDCSPDLTALLPSLLEKAPEVMVKLSPMADISMLAERLAGLREVHVVGVGGEVKELLCIIGRKADAPIRITVCEFRRDGSRFTMSFTPEEESAAGLTISPSPQEGQILYEPAACILKAGCHGILCGRYGLEKLDRFTHLYIVPGGTGRDLPGRYYRIDEVLPFGKAAIKDIASRHPGADVTARNIPMTTEELRNRLKRTEKPAAQATGIHIFGITASSGKVLLVTQRS